MSIAGIDVKIKVCTSDQVVEVTKGLTLSGPRDLVDWSSNLQRTSIFNK